MRKSRLLRSRNFWRAVTLATALSLALPQLWGSAQADPQDDQRRVSGKIAEAEEDLEGTSAELSAAHARLQATEGRLAAARDVLAKAEKYLQDSEDRDQEIAQQLHVAQASEAKAVADLLLTRKKTAKTSDEVGGIARQAYQSGGVGALAVAFTADNADDFAQRVTTIDLALKWQGQILAELAVQRAETVAVQTRLVAVRREVALLKAQSAAQVLKAAAAAVAAEKAKSAVSDIAEQQRKDVKLIADRKAGELDRLADLQAEQDRLAERLRELAAAEREAARRREAAAARPSGSSGSGDSGGSGGSNDAGASDGGSGTLAMPVPGARITSEFGMRYHPIWQTYRMHTGLDLGIGCGTPVRAAASGSVISAGWNNAYGNRLMIAHGQLNGVSLVTTYNHLTSISRSSGSVARGEVIGYSGTTGWSTGCHLHFETYADGVPVNPRGWL